MRSEKNADRAENRGGASIAIAAEDREPVQAENPRAP